MQFTKELREKAKAAGSAEKLLELAKAEGMELTAEEAEKAFAQLHKSGELADDELDNVSGGCGNDDPPYSKRSAAEVTFLYSVGQKVLAKNYNKVGVIEECVVWDLWGDPVYYFPYYKVVFGKEGLMSVTTGEWNIEPV